MASTVYIFCAPLCGSTINFAGKTQGLALLCAYPGRLSEPISQPWPLGQHSVCSCSTHNAQDTCVICSGATHCVFGFGWSYAGLQLLSDAYHELLGPHVFEVVTLLLPASFIQDRCLGSSTVIGASTT
jgi:hypothetical protein